MLPDAAITTTPTSVPFIELNDGYHMPALGLGVWQIDDDKVGEVVNAAIDAGYRLIDTAQGYDNEAGVGAAIQNSPVPREELFLVSKLRTKSMGYDEALAGIRESLDALQVDYLDMFLIHWPTPARDNFVDTWKAFVEAQKDGLVRSIGVSNFLPEHIERIIEATGVIPAVNQLETHPYYQQRSVRDFHEKLGIRMESYSPLGHGEVLDDKVIAAIADRLGKTEAQVIIRWHLQEGLIVIPKSESPDRIRANIDVFDFELSERDMAQIGGLDDPEGGRTSSDPATFNDQY
jgi:2,5-diketo-D-gluconate reductase A